MGQDYKWKSIFCQHTIHPAWCACWCWFTQSQRTSISSCFKPLKELVVFMKELAVFWMVIFFFKILKTVTCDFFFQLHLWINPNNCTDNLRGLFLIFNSQRRLALSTWSDVSFTPCWSLIKFWKWPDYSCSLFLQSLLRRISILVAMGILLLPQPSQNKAIQRSGEIESDIESYGEWKYNIYLPNCIKTSKNFSSVFGDFHFPNCLTSYCFPPDIWQVPV